MSGNVRFWRNFALIGLAHVVVIMGLVHWGNAARPAADQSIVWMSGGAGDAAAVVAEPNALTSPTPEPEQEPEASKESAPPVEEESARAATAQSEIQLPTPEPSATPSATPRPTPTATPKPTPHPVAKAIPLPSVKPKAKPKPSAKPTPKKMLAKATPKPKPTGQEKKLETEPEKSKSAESATSSVSPSAGSQGGGGGKNSSGGGAESRFGWYGNMLHDRFYSEWAQPTATLTAGAKVSTLVKVRIEKDGRVSSFEIVRSSGNPVVDDSITAMGKRVTQVDALPVGLGNGEHYDVKINFELNAEQ